MKERFEAVLGYLKMHGLANNAAEVAEKIHTKGANISKAKNGSMPKESAIRLLHRINAAYGNPFSPTYLESGFGPMLAADVAAQSNTPTNQPQESANAQLMQNDFVSILKKSQEQIDALISQRDFLKLSTMLTEQNSALLQRLSVSQN